MTKTADPSAALSALSPARIEAHLRFLSHPLLEGRAAGSRGGQLAEEYIRSVLAAAGIGPAPGHGYFQKVPFVGMDPAPELRFTTDPLLYDLDRRTDEADWSEARFKDDFVLKAGVPQERVAVESQLVFVGYGITAPEFGWDDYAGVDVRGKILLIRVNDPGTPDRPDFFGGRALTYYGRWTYKLEEAARRGAAGVLLMHTDESAGYGWNVVRSSNSGPQYQLAKSDDPKLPIKGWVTERIARALLGSVRDSAIAGADNAADALLAASARPGFKPIPLGVTVRASVNSTIQHVEGSNVIGVIPGSDPKHADEAIVMMSHHDHLGLKTSDTGETLVYAGAHDNASGVALLLSIAEAFAASGDRYARPMVFLASTAEESGLLGSEWYVRNPLFPLAKMAGVLNVDGANLHGLTNDIAPLGVDRSHLGDFVKRAASEEGLVVTPEQHPEQGMFFRQDHFPFARAGVPAIAFDHGLSFKDRPAGWGEAWYQDFNSNHYHQPSDCFSEDFDYRGALQQGRVMMRVAMELAG